MDNAIIVAAFFLILYNFLIYFVLSLSKPKRRLPPGPKPYPIIGNILEVGDKPHRSFANLAKVHGSLISLKLGSVTTIVVSSAEMAKEMFLKHDNTLSNQRTVPNSVTAGDHHMLTISWLPVSPKWRSWRKITSVHLVSNQRLNACSDLREGSVKNLYKYVLECSKTGKSVNVGKAAFTTVLNFMSNLIFSIEMGDHDSNKTQELKELVTTIMEDIGKPNYADYFPILKYVDPSGIRTRLAANFEKIIDVFQAIIQPRLAAKIDNPNYNATDDLLDVIIDLYHQKELTMEDINHLLINLIDAAADSTASTFEWGMAELVRNPEIMKKARAEMEQVLGKNADIKESDIPKLPYLEAIIKETLRLHPPTVFLLPRKADADVELCNYIVPKDAQILVNLWAIGRDPKAWENPDEFNPERFLGTDIDHKGKHFGLLPFGAGKRICPGMNLAYRMLVLMMATLVKSFDWKLEDGMSPMDMDMDESFGITMIKTVPLKAVPILIN